ncbi:diamine N-acetyltransferase [Lishizhenia tianjinensis]|uniref:Diamine N-acetyltransferase n=1 Tax=Lishizhenia tianjinensis TaxID=477690 RepID=A0A1I6X9W5_9FLAO|nr:GNAT family protein [Lishizhenia tianjinensis]SFT34801.1 diamine N-acetyltransferase [Lishizhenia tianjinensis]
MLKGDKIYLRRVETYDATTILFWENNPSNWRVSNTEIPFSLHEIEAFIDNAQAFRTTGQLRLMIIENQTNKSIGCLDFFEMNFKELRAGVGILINDHADRGKGFAQESLSIAEEYVKKVFNFRQLFCNIQADNTDSIALFEKLGYQKQGVKKDWYKIDGSYIDEYFYQKRFELNEE